MRVQPRLQVGEGAEVEQGFRQFLQRFDGQSEWKDFARPDKVRSFQHGRIELLLIGGGTVGRMTLEPGWRWSTDVKPIAGTEWC